MDSSEAPHFRRGYAGRDASKRLIQQTSPFPAPRQHTIVYSRVSPCRAIERSRLLQDA